MRVKTAQEKVENLYKDLSDLQEDAANLTIRAPLRVSSRM